MVKINSERVRIFRVESVIIRDDIAIHGKNTVFHDIGFIVLCHGRIIAPRDGDRERAHSGLCVSVRVVVSQRVSQGFGEVFPPVQRLHHRIGVVEIIGPRSIRIQGEGAVGSRCRRRRRQLRCRIIHVRIVVTNVARDVRRIDTVDSFRHAGCVIISHRSIIDAGNLNRHGGRARGKIEYGRIGRVHRNTENAIGEQSPAIVGSRRSAVIAAGNIDIGSRFDHDFPGVAAGISIVVKRVKNDDITRSNREDSHALVVSRSAGEADHFIPGNERSVHLISPLGKPAVTRS